MKAKYLLLLLLLFVCVISSAIEGIDENEYILKPGDRLLLQIVSADTVSRVMPILIEGDISLYPFCEPVKVAGKTLAQGKQLIHDKLSTKLKNSSIYIILADVSPILYHITGAVQFPGEFYAERPLTLYAALRFARGLMTTASHRIEILRNGRKIDVDLRKYLTLHDLSQNPLIYHDDIIHVDYAENFAKVFVNIDTLTTSELYEIDNYVTVREIRAGMERKHRWTNMEEIIVYHEGESRKVDLDYKVIAGDSLFFKVQERFLYLTGYVWRPGRFAFQAGETIDYYIKTAGGLKSTGSRKYAKLINREGQRVAYRGQPLRPGDTIYIPETWLSQTRTYLSSFSIIVSIVSALILLNMQIK
ncbi:MAG: SLBB domain-containing protein [Candidatus Cloacimonetes bacterium]|nr:SLBB domain-containing protein [Candidatus Cloacimonadota bacterium]